MWVHSKPFASRSARALLAASAVALVMTSFGAQAAPAVARQAAAAPQATVAGDSDFSARKRYRRGNAAGLAMMGMMIGTVGAVIANQQRREAYERAYAAPRYYAGGGYAHGYYGRSHGYVQPQPYVAPRAYGRNPAAINSWNNPYDNPTINRLNQESGAINYGPPRIGF
jgi:hypothetical protein